VSVFSRILSLSPSARLPILECGRAVERQLDEIEPGSPESTRLFGEFERLRHEYLAGFDERESTDRD
jgi:hypothetical protein